MRFPIAITLTIIVATALAGWRNHGQLASANLTYQQLRQQARAMGIKESASQNPSKRTRSHQPRRLDTASLATGLIAFASELDTLPKSSDTKSLDERNQSMLDWQRRLLAFDPAAMKNLIAEIHTTPDLNEENRLELLDMVLQTFAESHPQAALELLADSPNLLKNPEVRGYAAYVALLRGMEIDPAACTAWYRNHSELFPGDLAGRVTERLMRRTSLTNPKLAFQLIDELGVQDHNFAVGMITNPAKTSAQRDATLAAFRDYLTTIEDPKLRETLAFEGISSMITTAFFDGVDNGIQVIGNGSFTHEEIESYVSRVGFDISRNGAGKWIDWLAKEIPTPNVTTQVIPRLFGEWTMKDYQAAGEWLTASEDSPMKTATSAVYANALADRHPATAAQWALALPAGENRDQLLPRIYQSWLKADPAAAATFADQNGIAK